MDQLSGLPFGSLVDQIGEATPAPGGGTTSACACALGAALLEMAAAIEGRGEGERMRLLREHALELAERELGSYAPVLAARRLPADDPEQGDAHRRGAHRRKRRSARDRRGGK